MPAPKKKTTKKTATNKGKAKATPKKAVVKKTAKKKPKKAVKKSKKTVTKKVTKKRSLKGAKKTTKKVNNKSVQMQSDSKPETPPSKETVSLPSSAGPRLQEKVVATHKLMEMLERPMYRIAYVSAFSFIFVAVFGLLLPFLNTFNSQVANVCIADVCVDEGHLDTQNSGDTASSNESSSDGALAGVQQTTEPPILEYFDKIPDSLNAEQQFSLRVLNVQEVSVTVLSLETGEKYRINTDRLSAQNYRYVLKPDEFPNGNYKTNAELKNDGGLTIASLGFFTVLDTSQVETNEPEITSTITTQDANEDEKDELEDANLTGEAKVSNLPTDSIVVQENNSGADELEINTTEALSDQMENKEISPEIVKESVKKFSLKKFELTWRGEEVVVVETPDNYSQVQLYTRPKAGLRARFLGTMFKRDGDWLYIFNSSNIPNGEYELFATAKSNTDLKQSDSKIINVANQRPSTTVATTSERIVQRTYTPTSSLRNFYEVEPSQSESENISTISEQTNQIISNNLDSLNDLMKRYAVAIQSDNDVLVKAVEEEISNKKEELLLELTDSPESRDTVSQTDVELANRITQIKQRVDAFETVRRSRLNDTVSTDTDGDGISDFDERNVYKTDPESADSDGDGFNDGAEVVRGFDPTNATAEEIIRYELPTEVVGLERTDALTVAKVNPVIMKEENNEDKVFAEITGQGLPNSFVTIYIFSSPIIVTVKTDADGSFVYRFDKELEDGEHEVYVAFTDNTGSILAHSEPYQFIKQAQAFSPVDVENEGQVITAPTVVETSSESVTRTVLFLIILVLGFFLMMLGINIRETSPKMKLAENES